MYKKMLSKVLSVVIVGTMAVAACTGCGSREQDSAEILQEEVATSDSPDAGYVEALDDTEVASSDVLYTNANGWSLRYDPNVIAVNEGGPITTFVYTGDCAGTCMLTTTYDVGKDSKTAADELANSWGQEAKVTESTFLGTEGVTGYYVYMPPMDGGSGLVTSAFVRDYMDGILSFEFTIHNSGNDEIDIPVSDAFAMMVETLQFEAN